MPYTDYSPDITGEVARKLLICAADVSDGTGDPEWEIQGYKTEDASIEFNPDVSTTTDVIGDTYTDVNKFEAQITFEPNSLKMGRKLSLIMLEYWRNGDLPKFAQFKALIAYGFLGEPGSYEADMFEQCTVTPNSLGGSSLVGMPFQLNFGGERTRGVVDKLKTGLTFTKSV